MTPAIVAQALANVTGQTQYLATWPDGWRATPFPPGPVFTAFHPTRKPE